MFVEFKLQERQLFDEFTQVKQEELYIRQTEFDRKKPPMQFEQLAYEPQQEVQVVWHFKHKFELV